MRIGIDARFLTHPQTGGFKTYTENLIAALAEVDGKNEYILYIDRPPQADTCLPKCPNFRTCIVPGTRPIVGMPWREQVKLSHAAWRDNLNLFHSPNLTAPLRLPCPLVVTIHDMIWRFPEKFANDGHAAGILNSRKLMEWYYRYVPERAVRYASAVITVSHAAQADIVRYLSLPPTQVFVTYEAAKPIYRRLETLANTECVKQRFELTTNFILAIGSADPRKNIAGLIQAYALLPATLKEQYSLAIVWTHRFLAAGIAAQSEQLGLADHLKHLERVSDDELVLLYNAASLFVFPSLYEGFGLPLLEAMACGTPVVAANNSSIPEIVGDAGWLVAAQEPNTLAGAMTQALTDETLRNQSIHRGLARVTRFSWTQCARETLMIYQQAVR